MSFHCMQSFSFPKENVKKKKLKYFSQCKIFEEFHSVVNIFFMYIGRFNSTVFFITHCLLDAVIPFLLTFVKCKVSRALFVLCLWINQPSERKEQSRPFCFPIVGIFMYLRPSFPPAIFPVAQSFPPIILDTGLRKRKRTNRKSRLLVE